LILKPLSVSFPVSGGALVAPSSPPLQKLPGNFAACAYFFIVLSGLFTYLKITEPEVHA